MIKYEVKKSDLIGELKRYPIEVVQAMVDQQIKQGKEPNIKVFQKCKIALDDGFDWNLTINGFDFWNAVINRRDFNLFFEEYGIKIEKKKWCFENIRG